MNAEYKKTGIIIPGLVSVKFNIFEESHISYFESLILFLLSQLFDVSSKHKKISCVHDKATSVFDPFFDVRRKMLVSS